jgi:hypothetical protein
VNTIYFLRLENHFADFQLFQPLSIYQLDDLTYPVNAFYYDKRTSLMFLGLTNPSISGKINNYFSKLFSSSSKEENSPGFLLIYNIIRSKSGAHHFEPLYQKPLPAAVSSIDFSSSSNMLILGLTNGSIVLNKLFVDESSQVTKELIDELCTIKAHKKKVIGVCLNSSLGYVYSLAAEGSIVLSEMNYGSVMKSFPVSKKEMTTMAFDERWGRVFCTDENGSIWIVDLLSNPV